MYARSSLGLDLLRPHHRLHVCLGSFEEFECAVEDVDAAVMLETIEHIDAGRLPRVERAVFAHWAPRLILITTPNKEYNRLHGLAPNQRRHSGHRFEWDRRQFRAWCDGVGGRNGYEVRYHDVGSVDAVHGSSTQMAAFWKRS
jgi:small RNA 2'-O-methyltransferase